MACILIRKGLNGFRYSACGERGNHLFNANSISKITQHWKKEYQTGQITFIRQLDQFPSNWQQAGTALDTIGERLKAARKLMGLTQKECAALLDMPENAYYAIENNQRPVSRCIGRIIAVRLKVNSRWLLDGIGGMETADLMRKGQNHDE